jgi:hypothetical protein
LRLPSSALIVLSASASSIPPSTCVNQEHWLDSTTTPMQPCRPVFRLRAIDDGV